MLTNQYGSIIEPIKKVLYCT